MTMFRSSLQLLVRCSFLLVVVIALAACGGDDESVATEDEAGTGPSPQASNRQPDGSEETALEIVDGEITSDQLTLQQGEPTDLQIVNQDDEAYRFWIEGLVSEQEIAAGTTTDVEFTTPDADDYTGQLLGAEDDTVLDEVRVTVQGPGGIELD